jgi:hypothetical protein
MAKPDWDSPRQNVGRSMTNDELARLLRRYAEG